MSNVRWVLAMVLVAGCGSREEKPPEVRRYEGRSVRESKPQIAEPQVAPDRKLPIDIDMIVPPPTTNNQGVAPQPTPDPVPVPKAECIDEGTIVSFDPRQLRACFDTDSDDEPDRCVHWRRDGKVLAIDTIFDVETDPTAEIQIEPEFHTDEENDDEERITVDMGTVDICPYDRACMKLMPKVDGGEVQYVVTDGTYTKAALMIRDESSSTGRLEMWDLQTGRRRTKVPVKRLVEDETYDFSARLGSGVVVVLADNSDGRALGSIFGHEGGLRAEVAGGSRNLDVERIFEHAGVFGIVDMGPLDEDKPYVVHLHSLTTGQGMGRFTIHRDADGDDDLAFHKLKGAMVGAVQWDEEMRLDLIDLKTRTVRILRAPGC